MSDTITSSPVAASAAISELVGVDTSRVHQQSVVFSVTKGIAGMEKGRQVSNQLLQAVSDFSQAVLIQANKFPQLAAKLEKRDLEEAKRWGNQS
ncbi:TPA: TIGR04197 family type VII secretion effector [Streptococcus equi subsp. zooepidemicus]|nr:TIGR04197 family type VII secretion effector [Streptococcus equi subsp. zooepidemicus]